ncbi:hypothetical protein BC828DRAFT_148341 [Blastocladiella britannica]|nr:hypothetical protein BC828DRAFT_148341 [Blastocladiella britannica]
MRNHFPITYNIMSNSSLAQTQLSREPSVHSIIAPAPASTTTSSGFTAFLFRSNSKGHGVTLPATMTTLNLAGKNATPAIGSLRGICESAQPVGTKYSQGKGSARIGIGTQLPNRCAWQFRTPPGNIERGFGARGTVVAQGRRSNSPKRCRALAPGCGTSPCK